MTGLIQRRKFLSLMVGSALLPACQTPAQPSARPVRANSFRILDSLLYRRRPPNLGFPRVKVYGGGFWQGNNRQVPDEGAVRSHARLVAKNISIFVIDIEHWPMDIRKDSPEAVRESVRKMLQIYTWMKDEVPKLEIGVYAFPPIRDYWTPVRRLPGAMEAWRRANEALRPLAEGVDFIAPSLYTFYDNPKGWKTYAEANIAEAKRFNRPVLPVLWPRFHVSNEKLRDTYIPGDFWTIQLTTARDGGAEGLVLWDSTMSRPDSAFNPHWEWWKATQQFVKTL